MKRTVGLILIALAISCATNPATGRRQLILLSEPDEIRLGREADAGVRQEMGEYPNTDLQRYVDRIGQTLAKASHRPQLPWHFTVVDESAVNAFALPGGFIYVTRGILPFLRDEAELAAVMGHEVGHVDAKHGVDQYSKQLMTEGALAGASIMLPKWRTALGGLGVGAQFVFLKYGREAELESDRLGVGYASASGWAPQAMSGVLATLGRLDESVGSSRGIPSWALSHPPAEERVAKIKEAVTAAAAAGGGTATNTAAFDAMIDGIVYGDSREKGLIRGAEFVHPVMRFSVRFPEGWTIANGATQVSARPAEGNAAMLLEVVPGAAGSVADVARAEMSKAGLQETGGGATRVNGLEAYAGTYDGQLDGTPVRVRAVHIRSGGQVYRLAGIATVDAFAGADRSFGPALQSFRELSEAEAARIQPSRVRFAVVQAGDTWESLARRAGSFGGPSPAALAIMNGSEPASTPRPGARVRIVVAG